MERKPSVLFLCIHNAGRSQMAAAWLEHLAGGRIDVLSAGSEPADRVNPAAVAVMEEVGIDLRGREPRRWDMADLEAADVVVTMGCGDTCPVLPGKRYVDWPLPDPAGKGVESVRPIRDEIAQRVRGLIEELGVEPVEG
jgi:arsenate reductase (thioredoxin)